VSALPDLPGLARQLSQISLQVREAGDVPLVHISADGVAPLGVTLADELYLIAFQLDAEAAESVSREAGRLQ
jgi:hypothetical protein